MKPILDILAWITSMLPGRVERHSRAALKYLREVERRRAARREKGEASVDWLRLVAAFAIALLLLLSSGCASAPADVAALKAEISRLEKALEDCESSEGECADLLTDCESLLHN